MTWWRPVLLIAGLLLAAVMLATYFLFRVGLAYDIHLDERFGMAPGVNLDFVNGEEVWVYGLTLTYGF